MIRGAGLSLLCLAVHCEGCARRMWSGTTSRAEVLVLDIVAMHSAHDTLPRDSKFCCATEWIWWAQRPRDCTCCYELEPRYHASRYHDR
jgi:hypothetical protein